MNTDNNRETIYILRDLVKINNDRIEGYNKAIEDTKDADHNLTSMFRNMITQSEGYILDLEALILSRGGDQQDDDTTGRGKVYRLWMDIRGAITGHKPRTMLELCEYGEDAALKAYQNALESEAAFDIEVRNMIFRQETELHYAHDTIKSHRDQLLALE